MYYRINISYSTSDIGFCGSFRRQTGIGFVGWVTYEVKDEESKWNMITCMLAKYAEYANIGGNKTAHTDKQHYSEGLTVFHFILEKSFKLFSLLYQRLTCPTPIYSTDALK
jgi:hypothetical protein